MAPVSGVKSLRRAASKLDDSPLPTTEDDAPDDGADDGDEAEADEGATYCVCNQVSFGEMIGCDGDSCEREWVRPSLSSDLLGPGTDYSPISVPLIVGLASVLY